MPPPFSVPYTKDWSRKSLGTRHIQHLSMTGLFRIPPWNKNTKVQIFTGTLSVTSVMWLIVSTSGNETQVSIIIIIIIVMIASPWLDFSNEWFFCLQSQGEELPWRFLQLAGIDLTSRNDVVETPGKEDITVVSLFGLYFPFSIPPTLTRSLSSKKPHLITFTNAKITINQFEGPATSPLTFTHAKVTIEYMKGSVISPLLNTQWTKHDMQSFFQLASVTIEWKVKCSRWSSIEKITKCRCESTSSYCI